MQCTTLAVESIWMITRIFILVMLVMPCASGAQSSTLPQCFRFDWPLGTSATGIPEQGDSTWYIVQLGDSGIVRRPLLPKREREAWLRTHQWSAKGDTIQFRVGDLLVGWTVAMHPTGQSFTGVATYNGDAIAVGEGPIRVGVDATRIRCPALAP